MSDPFPVALVDYTTDRWRLWCVAVPEAVVADANVKPLAWCKAEDLKPCLHVAVGVHGISQQIAWQWTMQGVQPSPYQVNAALIQRRAVPA